jgi:beta-glucosidase
MEQRSMPLNGTITANITVTNSGTVAGDETVQCYIRDLSADVARPVLELKRFLRVHLEPGQSKPLQFELTAADLSYWNQDLKFKADTGKVKLFIGGSAVGLKEVEFEVVK